MDANGSYTFTMLFEPAEEGGYVVTCPALPGLVTEGDTLEEARRMAGDALTAVGRANDDAVADRVDVHVAASHL